MHRASPAVLLCALFVAADGHGQTIPVSADTKIIRTQPNATSGSLGWLHVNDRTGALFRFELPGVETPVDAELRVHVLDGGVRTAGPVAVYALAGPWQEQSVTWNTQPPLGMQGPVRPIAAEDSGSYVAFDVSSIVNEWLEDPSQNFGISLQQYAPTTDVIFQSRESAGGSVPALLVIEPRTAIDNTVTVAPSGGDYESPADAVENADSGDAWCDRTVSAPPCRILILAGTYVIERSIVMDRLVMSGAGPESTRLVAASNVYTVISTPSRNADGSPARGDRSRVEALAIVNEKLDSPAGAEAKAIESGYFELDNVNITVHANGPVAAVAVVFPTLTRVQVVAESRSASATGVFSYFDEDGDSGKVVLTDTNITVTGSEFAIGVYGGEIIATGSTIDATGGGDVYGVLLGDWRFPILTLQDSRVTARGPAATTKTALLSGEDCTASLRHSELGNFGEQAGGSALSLRSSSRPCSAEIVDSHLLGTLELGGAVSPSVVEVDRSTIEANVAVRGGAGFEARFGASKLVGEIVPGAATLTCVFSYDGDYQPLGASCE
jgi:hypothetical protein